jgi:predicted DNA-binding protein (MmcQ/YjbR family)
VAQDRQKIQADKHRREVNFDVGDEVFLTLRGLKQERPSLKLSNKSAGPYRIIRKVGHSFKLQLPDDMMIHPVFAPEKLRLAYKRDSEPLQGQIQDKEPPVKINNREEWTVKDILDSRVRYRKLQYKVDWQGHDEDKTWYPAINFKNAAHKIQEYHDRYPNKPGPPLRLQEWIHAMLHDEDLDDHADDNLPCTQRD